MFNSYLGIFRGMNHASGYMRAVYNPKGVSPMLFNTVKVFAVALCLLAGTSLLISDGLTGPSGSEKAFAAGLNSAKSDANPVSGSPQYAGKDYRCMQRSAKADPPPRLSPNFRARGKVREKKYYPINLRPICPQGQVAIPSSTKHFKPEDQKGNPLLGNIRDRRTFEKNPAEVIRRSLRPFKQVYWKGRGELEKHHAVGPMPQAACDGVAWFGSCYYYGTAAFTRQADGGGMTMSIERPAYVSGPDGGHTLNEIAIQGGAGNGNIIELGWNLSSDQYGDSDPHLFVFHWINWGPTCYDGCGWQQYSGTYFPGMNLNQLVGRQVYVGYVFYQGTWWAWFDNQWLGYFPGSEWGGAYTRSELIQWFGEVSSSNGVPPRTDMGNGRFPADPAAATMFTLCDVDAAAWVCWYRDMQNLGATVPAYYDIARTGFGATRYGGPGE